MYSNRFISLPERLLDYKTPFCVPYGLDEAATEYVNILIKCKKVTALGWEQEYFLVDRRWQILVLTL
jgi:glutamine synthetase type III